MFRPRRDSTWLLACVVGCVALVLSQRVLSDLLADSLGGVFTTLVFLGTVLVAGLLGGWKGGLAATTLSLFVAMVFFSPPYFVRVASSPVELLRLVSFTSSGLVLTGICELLLRGWRNADDRQRKLEEEVVERRRAQLAERARADELMTTLASIGDGVISTDSEGRIKFLNSVAEELVGWKTDEAHGRMLSDVFHIVNQTTRQTIENPAIRAMQEGIVVGLANHAILITKDGKERAIDYTAASIRGESETSLGVVLVFRDVTERRQVEDQFRLSEQRFNRFMQNLPGLAWIKDLQGRYVYANTAAEKAFRRPRADLYGKTDDEVFPPETAAQFKQNDERAISSVTGIQVVEVLKQADGELHYSIVSKFPILGSEDQTALIGGIAIDITAQRRVEQALRETEGRFRGLMEQAPFSIQVFDINGATVRVNQAWEELWGVTLDQMQGYNILEDKQLESRGVLHLVQRAFAGEPTHIPAVRYDPNETIPTRSRHADSVRWVGAVVYPLKDDKGQVREVVLVHEDVTARKRAEAAVQQSEEKLRLLADTIPQLAWMANTDGYIFWYNRRWYDYTGTTPEEMEGWGWQSLHDPGVLPQVLERWKGCIASGEPFDMVFPLKGADGQFRPFLTRVNPLRDEQNHIVYWFGTNTDISDIKRMEEALRDADRRKDQFLATLAHELRNPLAPIRNSLQILKMPRVDAATVQQTRDMMERQVHHLVRLVDDLLDVSRVMRGKVELRKEPVELAMIVARAVETANPLIETHEHQLDLSIPPESMLLDADPVRLVQVIGNLLNNSAKYSEPRGHIWLSACREGDQAVLRVRDTGIGIAPDLLPHVFELFVQADHSSAKAQGGLGIGLTLVKSLVEMHEGSVAASSAGLGQGSEFTVRLPLMFHRGDQTNNKESNAQYQTPAASGYRVLVVDDNRDAAMSFALLLQLHGHDVRVAHDGPSALGVAMSYLPNLIFLDIGMPGMDGCEVARRIRQQPELKNVMLAALTGWGQPEDRRRTAEAGFDHHLVKPPEAKEVEGVLADLRGRPSS